MKKETAPKRALVTGASSGIGRCMAGELAARGCDLVLVARNGKKLEELAAAIAAQYGVSCDIISADLSKAGAAAAVKAECDARGLPIGILVNDAGVGLFGLALEQDLEAVKSMVRLNIDALTELCALFGRDMAGRGSGRILNVSSMVALMPVPFVSTYAGSKAYVKSFSAALRAELRPRGVSVTCLLPGYVRTNFDAASNATNESYLKLSAAIGMPPEKVARIGVRALFRGKGSVVAGALNSVGAFFVGLIPKSLIARVAYGSLNRLLSKGAAPRR